MKSLMIAFLAASTLWACSAETPEEEPVLLVQPNLVASAPVPTPEEVATMAASAVSSPIVAQILSASEEADVITSSKQAMANVSASEVAAAASEAALTQEAQMVFVPEDDLPEVKLPETCERYYKRVDSCFAKQSENSEELRLMNQDARVDLAADKPTDKTCEALNQSFDAVARYLACE